MFGNKIIKTIFIEGMSCGHCSKRVEETLKSIDGVKSVSVSLEEKKAKLVLKKDISNEILKTSVEDIGFEVVDIKLDK
ncbi:MAG: heavy-metal-associated domain-containing protein [Clostridia bacterium]|nr:heavy-metal-associated domain-containing protein [Clostridia bacterium]